MNRTLKLFLFVCAGSAVALTLPIPAAAGPLSTGSQAFVNPDDLSDCPLAPPAFSANLEWMVYLTSSPTNPAAGLISPTNTDSFTVVLEVSNDLLLSLPVECTGGPYDGDPNPGDLVKLNVGTFSLGWGPPTWPYPVVGDYGTIDDGDPSTIAPSGYNPTLTSMEFLFDAPNIDAGESTQLLFFTIPSIEPGEIASCFLQTPTAALDDEIVVFLPLGTVAVDKMSWGVLKATFR